MVLKWLLPCFVGILRDVQGFLFGFEATSASFCCVARGASFCCNAGEEAQGRQGDGAEEAEGRSSAKCPPENHTNLATNLAKKSHKNL